MYQGVDVRLCIWRGEGQEGAWAKTWTLVWSRDHRSTADVQREATNLAGWRVLEREGIQAKQWGSHTCGLLS